VNLTLFGVRNSRAVTRPRHQLSAFDTIGLLRDVARHANTFDPVTMAHIDIVYLSQYV